MDADAPQSPFPPDFEPLGPAPYVPPDEPEPPRLGIIHLMVWTACAAVHLSVMRSLLPGDGSMETEPIPWIMYGVGAGAALGGLLLWVARRIRGERFPRHPGEYLLVVEGLSVAFYLVVWIPSLMFIMDNLDRFHFRTFEIVESVSYLVQMVFFLWAAVKIKVRRWRWFFLAQAGATLLGMPIACCGVLRGGNLQQITRLVIDVWLIVVVLKDHFQGLRFPWTHWLGVVIRFWLSATSLSWFVWRVLVDGMPF